jgi:malonate transporter and related proteins
MLTVLSIVTPVFALMGCGFLAARFKALPDGAGQTLAQFAFKIAMPALLFRAMLGTAEMQASPWRLLAAYFLATACVWIVASLAAAFILGKPKEDHAALAMGSTFGNTVMLGLPIAITAFGPDATAPLALLIAVETPLLWIVATLHMEAARRGRNISLDALGGVVRDLAANTIVMSLVFGLAGRALGLTLPAMPDKILALLGQAAVPVALFALGMALSAFKPAGEGRTLTLLTVLKLGLYPALAYVFSRHLFDLPPLWVALTVLMAAMPVGANAFLFASRYDRSAATVSAAIAVSTILAVATVSLLLLFMADSLSR